ncbi:protein MODIFIER OF SNC1 1 [Morus notabilis]|uniref:protein MODIFIER OF SNC1 1 n=1 Tax=Morus notabilis TaxID=981085 RepID=UPI000CED27B5|nr:protein MODIFIER OF SNC1 1 [Morus notabilis]XP_024025322.1 protein MODIFIER OF SNC1 1 [Morus notabilis]XP_024025324.1 protein MODIFIER OF SNC1 1 [Morus notabilis]
MTSSMLSGDRRWASSTRRGGMTVLGKVVVPKPINLPSQRSENHGLDPNVEIVPKGTLSWGSKSSSAWGSSSLSPNTDGGASSPSHLSGRPSSGSGTRPSTASCDRAYEPTANTYGPNSRPSSASGALTSNQTSLISLRPRSAETRPGSSQLSRFAEHSEHPVAWSSAGTAEKLGVTPAKNDGFSLTSGDFPTLGSGKESSGKNGSSSHSRPSSSSSGVGTGKERIEAPASGDMSASENFKNGTANSWKRDDPSYGEDGGRPGMEKWQGNPQTYPAPPQNYDAWHGTPMNNPQGGVWFRGPPPYGNPVAPAGFPMEPYSYYRPQIPATGIPNPQPVPPPGAGPRGPHPKNGDMYRPHMPDAYVRPGMPIRPGFYPGPVAYEGYYGPPMGYCSSNERDVPFMGMAAGPAVYNRYSGQGAPEPGNSHGRYANNQSQIGEQLESGQPQDNRGPYKVLLKQHDGWDRRNEEHRREGAVTNNSSRGDQLRISSWENDWRSDCKKDVESNTRKEPSDEASFETFDNHGPPSVPVKVKSPEGGGNGKAVDDISEKKLESESSGGSKASQPHATAPKDSSLIKKIEGLNAKVRASDGRSETMTVSSGENQRNKFQANAKANQNTNEAGRGPSYSERTHTAEITHPISHEVGISRGDKNFDSTAGTGTNISRRSTHGMQSRGDHYGRGRLKTQEAEGWQKKPSIPEPTAAVSAVHSETSILHLHDHHGSTEATDNLGSHSHGKLEGQSVSPMFEQSDNHAQRAKIKELAKQRTKQLQEEEEERSKKQMAKARAKLEELNRRTQAVEGSTEKLENASTGAVQTKQEESETSSESSVGARRYGPPKSASKSALGSKSNVVAEVNVSYSTGVENPCLPSSQVPSEAPKSATGEPLMMQAQSAPLQQEVNGANTVHNNAPQVHESNVSKQKRTGFKQKQSTNVTEAPRTHTDVEDNATASVGVVANEVHPSGGSTLPVNSNASADSSLHPRRKSKNTKNKHKTEDISALSSIGSKENVANVSQESGPPKASERQLDPTAAVQMQNIPRGVDRSSEQHPSSPNEDSHGRVNSHWKPQQSRRMPRNSQNSRTAEKFYGSDTAVWAPVRSHNKAEATDEASPKNTVDGVGPSVKSDNVQINPKNKRAEMERYVPKPVAKEMAQQGGSNHQPVASVINQTTTDDSIPRAGIGSQGNESSNNVGTVLGKAEFSVESRNGNNRHNKQGKVHGSWRQRGSTELTSTQGLQDGASYASNVNQNVQKSNELPHPQKADVSSVKEQENYSKEQENFSDEWRTTDDWGVSHNLNSVEPVSVPIVKDQGVTSRGKRHAFKGHKGMANNRDDDQKRSSGDTDRSHTQSSTSETTQVDLPASSKENRGVVEHPTSHWQPKSQALSANNHGGNRNNSGQNVGAEANRVESIQHDGVLPQPTHAKDINESSGQLIHDQSISEGNNGVEEPIHRHQESRRERKTASLKGQPHLPNQGPTDPVEPAPVNLETRQEQRSLSGFRRSGSQNNRYSRSQESRGDWNFSGQDNKQHNPHPNRERPRQNSHYEYQPVGSYNNKSNNSEGPKDSADSAGARTRGRGQNHSRRGGGNFYGRQSGVREDAGYD